MLLVYAAPRIFPMVYNIVKHFIEEDTKQKIVIMGGISLSLHPQFLSPSPQITGGRSYRSTYQLISYPRRTGGPDVNLIHSALIM